MTKRRFLQKLLSALAWSLFGGATLLAIAGIWYLENRPELKIWHSTYLDSEFHRSSAVSTFEDYLKLEDRLFSQLEEQITKKLPENDRTAINRFTSGSLSSPDQWKTNWNRSFLLPGAGPGVLLLHGMSDSPYSLRNIGAQLNAQGFSVLGLRLPGHGTAPSGLVRVEWEDMAAAVILAMRHLHKTTNGKPIYVIGYSNGAALAVHYALSALDNPDLPKPKGLALISPQIRITAVAALAKWQSMIGRFFDLRKLAWNSLQPEYDPYKYNSFAVNAGQQSFEITEEIQSKLSNLTKSEKLAGMPKILAFQSVADATIIATGVVEGLLQRLPPGGHHLVLFDIDRQGESLNTIVNDPFGVFEKALSNPVQPFTLTLITNRTTGGEKISALSRKAGQKDYQEAALDLEWPPDVFSLSHVALPFKPDDPLYGGQALDDQKIINIGRLDLRGERGVLQIPPGDILRQRWNPFFSIVAQRISVLVKE